MPSEELGRYSVYQVFDYGGREEVRSNVLAEEAIEAAQHYTHSVAARLGMTVQVIVVDQDDCIVFEWKFNEGVVFPTPEQLESARTVT